MRYAHTLWTVLACAAAQASAPCIVEQVTHGPSEHFQFQGVSSDGSKVALSQPLAGTSDAYRGALLDLQSGNLTPLPEAATNTGSFAPSGTRLVGAFSADGSPPEIVEVNLTDQTTTVLAAHPKADWLPSYSPDGQHVVFNSFRSGRSDIYLLHRSSGQLTRLTHFDGYDAHAEFSPDGTRILFHRMESQRDDGGYDFDLYVVQADGTGEVALTQSEVEISYGSWAPDSKTVVYSSDVGQTPEKHNLYVYDGHEHVRLTDGDWKDSYAYWQRDGRFITFNSDRSGTTQIHRIPMDGLDCVRP